MSIPFTATRRLALGVVACSLSIAAASAVAQDEAYPNRPIKIVVPFAAGSASDTVARIVGAALATSLKQPVVIDNKAGAGGTIGAASVAQASPDGYTLVLTSSSTHSGAAALVKRVPYDGVTDFVHVSRITNIPLMLVANPSKNLPDVAALIQASHNKVALNYGYGNASSQIATGTFNTEAKVDALGVPYKSQPPAVADLIAGQVDYMFGDISVVKAFVDAKKLVPLAVSTPARLPAFPNVPTLQEQGFKNFDLVVWVGLAAPKGTPPAISDKLAQAVSAALKNTEVVTKLTDAGMQVAPLAGEAMRAFAIDQQKIWTARAQAAGVKPE